jgi:hypothetical protein
LRALAAPVARARGVAVDADVVDDEDERSAT